MEYIRIQYIAYLYNGLCLLFPLSDIGWYEGMQEQTKLSYFSSRFHTFTCLFVENYNGACDCWNVSLSYSAQVTTCSLNIWYLPFSTFR